MIYSHVSVCSSEAGFPPTASEVQDCHLSTESKQARERDTVEITADLHLSSHHMTTRPEPEPKYPLHTRKKNTGL